MYLYMYLDKWMIFLNLCTKVLYAIVVALAIAVVIVEFYPSITNKLLIKAINFAQQYTTIEDHEKEIIIHAKRTIVFNSSEPWKRRDYTSRFDDTMHGQFRWSRDLRTGLVLYAFPSPNKIWQ